LLPGPIRFNAGAGTSYLVIDASGSGGGAVITQPGGVTADGQTVLYNTTGTIHFQILGASSVNAAVAPLYPPPNDAFVKGFGIRGIPIYLSPSEHFVQTLYVDVLGRAGSLAEVDGWAGQLDALHISQGTVAADIEMYFEARDRLVKTWYSTYLGRQAQGGEELGWVNQLLGGQSKEQVPSGLPFFFASAMPSEERVLSGILGSPEFDQHAQTLIATGTPDQRYVQALYQVLLGRSASSAEVTAWEAVLPKLAPQGTALAFLGGPEFRSDQFAGYYNALLRRPDDRAALEAWVNSNLDILSVRIGFESGAEFYANG
jgi:hypothetical protein